MNFENVIFTTNKNGASEILDKKYIMKSPLDTEIISSIDSLLNNRPLLESTKLNNRKKSKLFSIENNLDKTLEVIDQIN